MSTTGMYEREIYLQQFLAAHGWHNAVREPVPGDASFRKYECLTMGEKKAILMDAPPPQEDVRPFIHVDNYLRELGLSAPGIYAQDEVQGFLLLEDLGRDSFTRLLAGKSPLSSRYKEIELYQAAVEVLLQIHRSAYPSALPGYDDILLYKENSLLIDWYCPQACEALSERERNAFITLWQSLYTHKKAGNDVAVLRDYHADNLMWLPGRQGTKRVGLLDFQDAVTGAPAYDLVSLLEDARRDVAPETVKAVLEYYIQERKDIDRDLFLNSYAVLAAQRNCKIIGIFSRLAVRDNKLRYLHYLPRVWKHLEKDLEAPVLAPLKTWLDAVIPPEKRLLEAFRYPVREEGQRVQL